MAGSNGSTKLSSQKAPPAPVPPKPSLIGRLTLRGKRVASRKSTQSVGPPGDQARVAQSMGIFRPE